MRSLKMNNTHEFLIRTATTLVLFACLWTVAFQLSTTAFFCLLIGVSILIAREWLALCTKTTIPFLWTLTPIYPFGPLILLGLLNSSSHYHLLIFPLFAITALHDIGSYIFGKSLGKRVLFPSISPKKTYEGALGGLCTVFALLLICAKYSQTHYTIVALISICIAWSLCALCGDLFESWLKRKANLKDSGNLLPGHGGILDRFDSVFFVSVFVYVWRDALLQLFTFF